MKTTQVSGLMTLIFFLLFCLEITPVGAQSHKLMVQTSIGIAPTFLKDKTQSEMPPVAVEVSYRFHPKFSLGAYWGHSYSSGERQPVLDGPTYRSFNNFNVFTLRPTLHTVPWKKTEFFGGMMIGYASSEVDHQLLSDTGGRIQYTEPALPKSNKGIFLSAFLGMRYRLTPRLGISGELGMGVSLLSCGISYQI